MAETMSKKVLDKMPVGYALHKLILNEAGIPCDCEYIEVNKAFEETTGLKASDVIGKRSSEIFPDIADDVADIYMSYAEVALNGKSIEHEQNLTTLGKWYRVCAYSPKKGYFVTLISDITNERRRCVSLEESSKLLSDFLDSNDGLVFLKDDKLRHTFVNRAFCAFWDKKREDIVGKTDNEIYPPELKDRFKAADVEVLNNRSSLKYEVPVRGKVFETNKFPIQYPNGSSGIGAYITDITEQKKQEELLSRQLYRQNILVDVFMKDFSDQQELLDYTLHRALELTGSQYGYIYLYDEELQEFTLNSWTIGVLAACEVADKKTVYKLESTGIWAEVIRQRKPIIINDLSQPNPLKKGYPTGHVELKNFLSVPIVVDEKIVAVAGLGNKSTDYSDSDVNELIILMQSSWLAVDKKSAQTQTLTERERFKSILDELPAFICEFLPGGTLTFANKEYCSYFGISSEELPQLSVLDLLPEDERESAIQRHQSLTPKNRTTDFEHKLIVKGQLRWHRWRNIGMFDEQGQASRFYSIGFDITEQKVLSEERERLLAQMFAMFNDHEAVMLFIEPISGRIMDANPSASVFYGYSKEELLNLNIEDINQLPKEIVAAGRLKILNKEKRHFTAPHKLKNGQIRIVDIVSTPVLHNGMTVNFSIMYDVTEREEAFKEIVYISYHDYLTGAYNRRFFEEEYARLNTESNYPISVVMGDVNGLKLINDAFGHHFGDELIKSAAKSISACLRLGDISARIGGDEFGVILPKTNEIEATAIVSQIKLNIESESIIYPSESSLLSISFGFATQGAVKVGLGTLMKEAEGYMYSKKFYNSRSLKGKTINIVMKTLFEKSPMDKMHSERVGNISAAIAEKLYFEKERVNKIRVAGFLHDIGKIGIPENLLNKEGKLNAAEWEIVKTHPEKSWRILENTFEYSEISNIVLCHHEKWDGSGYPSGLKGEEIPLEARIISAADAYDAMTNSRSYREKISTAQAIEELKRCSGTHFDPKIVEVFVGEVLTNEKDFLSSSNPMSDWYDSGLSV